MSEHPPPSDLDRFVHGTLSREKRRDVLAHLLRGCASCSSALARYCGFSDLFKPAPAEDYGAALDQAFERVSEAAGGRQEAVAMLHSLLAGERSWHDLSGSEVALLGDLPRVQALIEANRALRHEDPQATLRCAKLARCAADGLRVRDFGRKPVADLRALAWAELANAYRICDDLDQAHRTMNRAVYWCTRGSRSRVLAARVGDLMASLLMNQRRFKEARELLALVCRLYTEEREYHLAGRALISAGHLEATAGVPGEALLLLRCGLDLVDPDRDPQLVAQTLRGMIWLLVELGRVRVARRLLFRSRVLFVEQGSRLDLLRLRWLEGRIHAGLADFSRAEAAFKETQTGFAEAGQVYPAALTGLDLAALWLRQGRIGEIQVLTGEIIATFRALRIAREAVATLVVLQRACEWQEAPLLEIIELAAHLLEELDHQPAKRTSS